MNTEYVIATALVFWGDRLNPYELAEQIKLEKTLCQFTSKGAALLKPDGSDSGSVAKTGRLVYDHGKVVPNERRNPSAQLTGITRILSAISDPLIDNETIDASELQIALYYREREKGEVDFKIPTNLLSLLARHGIEVRITVLP